MKPLLKLNSSIFSVFVAIIGIEISTPTFAQQPQRLNLIIEVKGKVEIFRDYSKNLKKVFLGAFISSNDKLKISKGGSVKVFCADGKSRIFSNVEIWVSHSCDTNSRVLAKKLDSATTYTRGNAKNANIPYLISPRNTAIMTSIPTLRWHPIAAGATSYSLQILSGGDIIWETQVSQPMVVYAGAPLKPGIVYDVVISTGGGISTKNSDEPKFLVLDNDKISQIKADLKNIQSQSFNPDAKSLALAHLYRSNDLNGMAIDELERLVKDGSKITAVYQLLGDIYRQIGLNSLAKVRYETGLTLARKEGNLEAQESIQIGSIEVNKALD
jgi:hypothetical protein